MHTKLTLSLRLSITPSICETNNDSAFSITKIFLITKKELAKKMAILFTTHALQLKQVSFRSHSPHPTPPPTD
jgi:hypothetical protein